MLKICQTCGCIFRMQVTSHNTQTSSTVTIQDSLDALRIIRAATSQKRFEDERAVSALHIARVIGLKFAVRSRMMFPSSSAENYSVADTSEGIYGIRWKDLTHAYGSAEDVPDLIRALSTDDGHEQAVDDFYSMLCHQGTVYNATAAVIPFLIELLHTCRDKERRYSFLRMLSDCANGASYLAVHGELDHSHEQKSKQFNAQLNEELRAVGATRTAVWQGFHVYISMVSDSCESVRIIAPYTLTSLCVVEPFPEQLLSIEPCKMVIDALTRQLVEEPNQVVRASLIFALNALARHQPSLESLIDKYITDPASGKRERLAAALCTALNHRMTTLAMDVLVTAVKNDETDCLFPDIFPWIDESGWTACILDQLAANAKDDQIEEILPVLLAELDGNKYECSAETRALKVVFGKSKITSSTERSDLTAPQFKVLERMYNNYSLWQLALLHDLDEFGLSRNRDDLGRLLDIQNAEPGADEIRRILQTYAFRTDGVVTGLVLSKVGSRTFFPYLKEFPQLNHLRAGQIKLTDDDLLHIVNCPMIKELHLECTDITDKGASLLSTLRHLEVLNISNTKITGAGLKHLYGLKKLWRVYTMNMEITQRQLDQFRKALPKCELM